MRHRVWIAAWVVALFGGGRELRADPCCCPPPAGGFLQRLAPAGSWNRYGGGLLHWWPRCCFPCPGGPDDYCRKPLPRVCWPPYPPCYTWGPPPAGHREGERGVSAPCCTKPEASASGAPAGGLPTGPGLR